MRLELAMILESWDFLNKNWESNIHWRQKMMRKENIGFYFNKCLFSSLLYSKEEMKKKKIVVVVCCRNGETIGREKEEELLHLSHTNIAIVVDFLRFIIKKIFLFSSLPHSFLLHDCISSFFCVFFSSHCGEAI